jgi:hypothetical protein
MMKKGALGIVVAGLMMITACSKTASSNLGGTWSFKSTNYTATSFATGYSIVTVTNQPTAYSTDYTTLTVNFYNGRPVNNSVSNVYNGTYVVEPGVSLDSTNQIDISLTITSNGTSTLYHTTGGGGNETMNVNVTNNVISISGSNIELANAINPADSGSLNLNLVQPQ